MLLASSENKNSLKAINNVIKNSNFTHDSQIIEEKSDILEKLIAYQLKNNKLEFYVNPIQ